MIGYIVTVPEVLGKVGSRMWTGADIFARIWAGLMSEMEATAFVRPLGTGGGTNLESGWTEQDLGNLETRCCYYPELKPTLRLKQYRLIKL